MTSFRKVDLSFARKIAEKGIGQGTTDEELLAVSYAAYRTPDATRGFQIRHTKGELIAFLPVYMDPTGEYLTSYLEDTRCLTEGSEYTIYLEYEPAPEEVDKRRAKADLTLDFSQAELVTFADEIAYTKYRRRNQKKREEGRERILSLWLSGEAQMDAMEQSKEPVMESSYLLKMQNSLEYLLANWDTAMVQLYPVLSILEWLRKQ